MEEEVEGMQHTHDHEHSHGKKEVTEDRSIDNYQGSWKSVYPYMSDPIFKSAAPFMAEAEDMGIEEAWDFFLKGNETTVRYINIQGDTIEFIDESGETCKAAYAYDGWYSDCWGETSIRYQFRKVSGDEAAPGYVQFDDHLNYDTKAEHFHVYCGEDAKAMLEIADNWPTYYSAAIDNADDMLSEFMEHYVDPHEVEELDAHEMEVSAFEDDEVKNRPLLCWNGTWQSAYPYVLDGSLDEGFAKKAEFGEKTAEEYKEYYAAGYQTDIAAITVNADDSTIEFTDINGNTCKSKYIYLGYYLQSWSSGSRAAMYRFKALDPDSGVPVYIEFNDHLIEPCMAEHFHIRTSNTGFDDIEDPEHRWPTFFPASLDARGVLDAFTGHGSNHEHHHEEEKEADEHVWLSLRNAEKLVKIIAEAMAGIDDAHADLYTVNAAAYIEKLAALDEEYTKAVEASPVRTVLFGDRFPFRYLTDDYGLNYYAAFSGCSAESEASFATIAFLAQKVDELDLPAVLTIEGANHKIAETVAETSGHQNLKILTLDSLQRITAQDVALGRTYLGVMEANLEVLKDALAR